MGSLLRVLVKSQPQGVCLLQICLRSEDHRLTCHFLIFSFNLEYWAVNWKEDNFCLWRKRKVNNLNGRLSGSKWTVSKYKCCWIEWSKLNCVQPSCVKGFYFGLENYSKIWGNLPSSCLYIKWVALIFFPTWNEQDLC